MIEDVIARDRPPPARRWRRARPTTCAVPTAPVVAFSPAMAEADRAIKGFLYPRMYRHPRVMRIMGEAEAWCATCSRATREQPDDLPAEWAQRIEAARRGAARCAASPISSPA